MKASPLFSTAIVLAGLAGMAVPLHRLTYGAAARAPAAAAVAAPAGEVRPGLLRLRLLAPAGMVAIRDRAGGLLWESGPLPAGEHEHALAALAIEAGHLDLEVAADFPGLEGETALFLTVLPDGLDERVAWLVGPASARDWLEFNWH
jgi:hypothetical protein